MKYVPILLIITGTTILIASALLLNKTPQLATPSPTNPPSLKSQTPVSNDSEGLINPEKMLNRARDAQRKADVNKLRNALEMYYADNNKYPQQLDELELMLYIEKVPQDSDPTTPYQYTKEQNDWYTISAQLSDGTKYTLTRP